jgi:hypothetical protein
MALSILWVIGVFVVNVVLGALLVLGVFTFMERNVAVGALGGVVLGGATIWGEATLGEQYLDIGVPGMKNLVTAAALGAVIGVVGTVLVVEPDL